MRIFILDDSRFVAQALLDTRRPDLGGAHQITLVRPFRWDGEKIEQSFDDAFWTVINQPVFDCWILDNDLGTGLEGYDFLKQVCEGMPDRVPPLVYSCSANPQARANIEAYAANWHAHTRDSK